MKKQFQSKAVPRGTRTIWRYLGALFILFTFAVGNVWGAYDVPADGTVTLSQKVNNGGRFNVEASGVYHFRTSSGYSWDSSNGIKTQSNEGGVVFYLDASKEIEVGIVHTEAKNAHDVTVHVYSITESVYKQFDDNKAGAAESNRTFSTAPTSSTDGSFTISITAESKTFTGKKTLAAGYYAVVPVGEKSKTFFKTIKFTTTGGGTDVCPSGLTISSKNDQTAFTEGDKIELTAALEAGNGTITYQWYKGSVAAGNAISGATSAKYEKSNCTTAAAGDYFCVASKTSCSDAVNASAFAITVAADPKCFNMPEITSKPADLAHVTVTDGTLSDVSTAKAVAMNAAGLKLDGNYVYLKVSLASASIVEGTKITVAWKGAGSGAGIALVNENLEHKVIDLTGISDAAGSISHTFTAAEAADYADEFIIHRNASGTGIYVNAITVEDCGPAVTKHTVTLNYNDGVTDNGTLNVVEGKAAVKPADPTRGKYTFLGWFVGDTDNEYVWSTAVTGDITLKAHWQDPWTISFDADGGSEVADITVKHNTAADKPTDPTKDDNDFLGWFNGENAYDWTAVVTGNLNLKAHWAPIVAKYDVEYYDGETKIGTEAQVWANQHPTATGINTYKPLYTFVGWYTSSTLEGDPVALNTVTPVEGLKIYGKWAKAYASNADFEAYIKANTSEKDDSVKADTYVKSLNYALSKKLGTTFDANTSSNNGAYAGLKIKNSGTVLSWNVVAGKVVELKAGVMVANGSLAINGGAATEIDGGSTGSGDNFKIHYFYSATEALYEFTTSNGSAEVIKAITMRDPYQVNYDPHGADAIAAQPATPSVTLPTPVNGTGVFKGWYDAETEGNKIGNAGATYTPTASITLHAQWETLSSDNTLASWKIDGVAKDVPVSRILYIEEPYGVTPVISEAVATANVGLETPIATVAVSNTPVHYQDATEDFWYVQAEVTPQDPTAAHGYYQVRYTNAPKLGATIFKAELTAADDADYSGMYADEANSQIALSDDGANGYKFAGKSNFIKMAIADAAFAEGDMLKMTYTTNPQQGELAIYDGTTKLQGTPYTNNTLTFSDAVGTDKSTLFIRRTDDNKFNGWVAAVEVQRYMDPVIKSFTIGEAVGTIDQVNKTIAVEVPYGTNVTALTPVIAAYANGGATLDKTGAQDFSSPVSYQVSSAYAEDAPVVYTVTVTVADHYEAMIVGGASYATLVAAVAAAQADDVVQLLDNVDLMATGLTISQNITLDLNGFNIKAGEQIDNDILVSAGKKLTLVDNSANAEGKIYTEQAYTGAVTGYGLVRVAGELLMQSGNIYAVIDSDPANLGQFAVVIAAGGKVTVEGGQIKAGWYAISNNGLNSGSTIIVSGGELISTADYAIYNPSANSTVTVSGGVVYGAAGGIAMNRGELTVTGGTITSKDQGTTGTWGDGTGGLSNAAISASGKYESVEVEISGGTIIAEGTAVMITNGTTNPVEVAISGGQFSHVVPAEYCAEGFAPVTTPNAQGKYEVEDKRIYIFDGSTMSNMATSPSGAIAWAKVGDTMGEASKSGTYDEVNYTKSLQLKNSSTTKHFRIDVDINNNAKIEVIGMSNDDSSTRSAWLTNSTEKGDFADAIAGLTTTGYNPEMFATDWLEEGSYYLHADNTVNIFLIRVTPKAVDPKCEQPTITAQPETNITFGAGNMTATVVAEVSDEGTLTYQWYNAANDEAVVGQTTATLTTADEGTYYVIVTNTKASHRDNSIKSDEAQLAHRVMNDATLSALSYGDPATAITLVPDQYEYDVYLAKGTTDVPQLNATATMNGYAIVNTTDAVEFVNYEATSTVNVESEDHSANLTYTVHFKVAHSIDALVDVTENTIWDWTEITARADGSAIDEIISNKKHGPRVATEEGLVLANYVLGGNNWDKIEGNNSAYAIRNSENMFYQGANLHIHTTKGGMLKIKARNDGSTMSLKVENAGRDMNLGTLPKNNFQDYVVYVQAGDVVIYNDPETAGKPMRVQRIEFTVKETPDYTRNVSNNIGTLCVDHNVLAGGFLGATFYQIASRNQEYDYKIDFEEVLPGEELKAGEPYIFKSTTGKIELYYGTTSVTEPEAVRGMHGAYVGFTLGITDDNKSDILYIANNKLWNCEDLVGIGLSVVENRAYIVMSEVPTYDEYHNQQPNNAPIRRCLTISGDQAPAVITGIEDLNVGDQPVKVMIDGQMFILRGEKMYDAQGRLVK